MLHFLPADFCVLVWLLLSCGTNSKCLRQAVFVWWCCYIYICIILLMMWCCISSPKILELHFVCKEGVVARRVSLASSLVLPTFWCYFMPIRQPWECPFALFICLDMPPVLSMLVCMSKCHWRQRCGLCWRHHCPERWAPNWSFKTYRIYH